MLYFINLINEMSVEKSIDFGLQIGLLYFNVYISYL